MIYSVYYNSESLEKDPSLLSKVRQDDLGWRVKKNVIAYKGKARVQVEADDYFGGSDSQPYLSRVLTNPTYGTLFNHAKKAQQMTKDFHHVFFEGIWVYTMEDDVAIIRPCLGS